MLQLTKFLNKQFDINDNFSNEFVLNENLNLRFFISKLKLRLVPLKFR